MSERFDPVTDRHQQFTGLPTPPITPLIRDRGHRLDLVVPLILHTRQCHDGL